MANLFSLRFSFSIKKRSRKTFQISFCTSINTSIYQKANLEINKNPISIIWCLLLLLKYEAQVLRSHRTSLLFKCEILLLWRSKFYPGKLFPVFDKAKMYEKLFHLFIFLPHFPPSLTLHRLNAI